MEAGARQAGFGVIGCLSLVDPRRGKRTNAHQLPKLMPYREGEAAIRGLFWANLSKLMPDELSCADDYIR